MWRSPKQRKRQAQIRFNEQLAQKILDAASENPSPSALRRKFGFGAKTLLWWVYASNQEKVAFEERRLGREPKYLISWPTDTEVEPRWFHDLFKLATRMHSLTLDLENRSEALLGSRRPVRDPRTNRQLYELDEENVRFVGHPDPFSEQARSIADTLGLDDFPFAHDEDGRRIPVVEHVPQPAQLKIHNLRALAPATYDLTDKVEHAGSIQSHVLVVGGNKSIDRSTVSPMRNDLEQRLAAIRANGPQNPKPDRPLLIHGQGASDPPEKTGAGAPVDACTVPPPREPVADVPPDVPPQPLAEHPRAYHVPRPSYARPDEHGRPAEPLDRGGYGRGEPPAGGMRVV